jgi:hypothetical protein
MPQFLIVNPSERKKGKTMAKAKRSPAQRAATKRMIAANRARRKGPSVSRAKPARKASRKPRRASTARSAPARSAPRRSTKKRRSHPITSRAEGSRAGRKLRYRRKNPMGGFIGDTLIPSALGGAGALTLDVLLGVVPLPAMMKTPMMAPVVKVAAAIGLGWLASKVTSKRTANQIAVGAISVTLYNVAKAGLIKVGGGKIPGLSAYPDGYMGEYVSEYIDENGDVQQQIGYSSTGEMVGDLMPDGSVEGYETGVYR